VDLLAVVRVHRRCEHLEVGMGRRVEVDREVHVVDALVTHDLPLVGAKLCLDVGLEVDHDVVALVPELLELLDRDDPRGRDPLADPPEVVARVDAHEYSPTTWSMSLRRRRFATTPATPQTSSTPGDEGTTMAGRPTYLPMLEAIANAERQGHAYYQAWYDHATDPDLKETMRIVATRELEHSLAFTKRIDELGFECQPAEILDYTKQIEIVTSDCSDYGKVQALELTDLAAKVADLENDPFRRLFNDLTIEVQTGALLGRYIAEERDSARMLAACATAMVAKYGSVDASGDESVDRLAVLDEKLDALCAAVGHVQQTVSGKPAANGKDKAKATASA